MNGWGGVEEGEFVQSKGKITEIFLGGRGRLATLREGDTLGEDSEDKHLPLPMKMRSILAVDGGWGRIVATAMD